LFTLYWNSPYSFFAKDVEPLEPSDLGVIRGLKPQGDFADKVAKVPSDQILINMQWQNNTGSSVLIKDMHLVLTDTKNNSQEFFLVGEYPELSWEVLNKRHTDPYKYIGSLIRPILPHEMF